MKHQPPALSQTVTFGLQRASEARTDLRGYLLAATTRCSLCRQAAASGPGSGPCSWAATRAANLCSSSGWASLRGERADRGVRAELRPSQSLTKLRDRPDSCHPPPNRAAGTGPASGSSLPPPRTWRPPRSAPKAAPQRRAVRCGWLRGDAVLLQRFRPRGKVPGRWRGGHWEK